MDPWWGLVVPSYLFGAFLSAIVVGRAVGHDPTVEGSGNPGASNVYRVAGPTAGAFVLAADVVKGLVPTAAGYAVSGRSLAVACGLAAVLGHIAPITRRFRGGKGVATLGGVVLVLEPITAAALAGVWVAVTVVGHRASVASLLAVALVPLASALQGRGGRELAALAVVSSVVIVRHHENIRRLLRGDELPVAS